MRKILLPAEFPGKALSLYEQREFLSELIQYMAKRWWTKWLFVFFDILYNPRTKRLERVEIIVALERPEDEVFKFFYIKFKDEVTIKLDCYLKM